MSEENQNKDVKFYKPSYSLKAKAGVGGLNEMALHAAQKVIDTNKTDFKPYAKNFLRDFKSTLLKASRKLDSDEGIDKSDSEDVFQSLTVAAMQLKSNGAMFKYPSITDIANQLMWLLDEIKYIDSEMMDVLQVYYNTLTIVIEKEIHGDEGSESNRLQKELDSACQRYFKKHPDNKDTSD